MNIDDYLRASESRLTPRGRQTGQASRSQRIRALFDNSDQIFDRSETVLDDEDETEDTDEDRV
jgi:hypothetical protein